MNRKKIIYLTDLIIVPLFVLSLYTGIELHIAGHGTHHEIWHQWGVFHTIISLLFTLFGIIHIKAHWAWYRGLKTKGVKGKSKSTLILSLAFVLSIITGALLLFCVDGAHSPIGLVHYKIALMAGVLGILHLLKRIHFLHHGFTANLLNKKTRKKVSKTSQKLLFFQEDSLKK